MSRKITLKQARELSLLSLKKRNMTEKEYEKERKKILDRCSEEEICPCCNGTGRIEKKKLSRFEIMDI